MTTYRSDIDGLRAIAVLAVLFGHAFEAVLPGGYLGVDVFFVISGFVIASSLFGRADTGLIRHVLSFLLRRLKRLMPALLLCVLVTCCVLMFIDPSPKVSLVTGGWAIFGLSNFFLYDQELDYFSASVAYNAFTHTWSLGVEEQFYLLFPVCYWLLLRAKGNFERRLGLFIGALSLLSLLAFVLLEAEAATFAYYMMPTRFWQIGAGVVLACLVRKGRGLAPALAGPVAQSGYIALLGLLFVVPLQPAALGHVLAVVGTGLLLWSGALGRGNHWGLTNPASVYVGRISYSLYLWHWPFLVFGLFAVDSWVADPLLALLAAFAVASLSYHFVEQPVRRFPTPEPKGRYFGTAFGAIVAVIAIVALGDDYRKGLPKDPFEAALRPAFANLPDSDMTFNPHCVVALHEPALQLKPDTFDKCTFPPVKAGEDRMVWVLGDSHAGHLQGGLLKLREDYGFGVHLVETPGNAYPSSKPEGFAERETLMASVRQNWKAGDVVVLGRLLLSRTATPGPFEDLEAWYPKLAEFAQSLEGKGIQLILLGPPPMYQFEDLRACSPSEVLSCAIDRKTQRAVVEGIHQKLDAIAAPHDFVKVLDVFDVFCPEVAPICSPLRKGVFTMRDRDHFNVHGAALLMPHLVRKIAE